MRIDDIDTPSLLVDIDRLERNINRMAKFTKDCGVELRPHVKRLEASGARLPVAVAEALREELAGQGREHAELRALGAHGLSRLIAFRVGP